MSVIRLHVALLSFLWSVFQTDTAATDVATTTETTTEKTTTTDAEIPTLTQRQYNAKIAEERRAWEAKAKRDTEAAAENARLTEAEAKGELQQVNDGLKQRITAIESEKEAADARWKERVIRSDIRVAATQANFIDPDDAYRLLDHGTLTFSDDGEITNATEQIAALAARKPHLVKTDTPRGGGPLPRPANTEMTRDDIKDKYLRQAGVTRS